MPPSRDLPLPPPPRHLPGPLDHTPNTTHRDPRTAPNKHSPTRISYRLPQADRRRTNTVGHRNNNHHRHPHLSLACQPKQLASITTTPINVTDPPHQQLACHRNKTAWPTPQHHDSDLATTTTNPPDPNTANSPQPTSNKPPHLAPPKQSKPQPPTADT